MSVKGKEWRIKAYANIKKIGTQFTDKINKGVEHQSDMSKMYEKKYKKQLHRHLVSIYLFELTGTMQIFNQSI